MKVVIPKWQGICEKLVIPVRPAGLRRAKGIEYAVGCFVFVAGSLPVLGAPLAQTATGLRPGLFWAAAMAAPRHTYHYLAT
jgi:hypothetical protein